MTTGSERASAQSRGRTMAAPASASRIRALEYAGLKFCWIDDITVFVEGAYRFNLAGSSWVRIDDPNVHGYLVATLVTDFKKRNSGKPVTGRDNVQAELEATELHQHVESVTGCFSPKPAEAGTAPQPNSDRACRLRQR